MSKVERLERIEADIQEAHLEGDSFSYRDARVHKYAWMCTECRLVWSMKWHAESCDSRNHATSFPQEYPSSLLDSYGKPYPPTIYIREAIRREPARAREGVTDAAPLAPRRQVTRVREYSVKARNDLYLFHICGEPAVKVQALYASARLPLHAPKQATMRGLIVWSFSIAVGDDSVTHVCITPEQASTLGVAKP